MKLTAETVAPSSDHGCRMLVPAPVPRAVHYVQLDPHGHATVVVQPLAGAEADVRVPGNLRSAFQPLIRIDVLALAGAPRASYTSQTMTASAAMGAVLFKLFITYYRPRQASGRSGGERRNRRKHPARRFRSGHQITFSAI
jgi:hypothetical protein